MKEENRQLKTMLLNQAGSRRPSWADISDLNLNRPPPLRAQKSVPNTPMGIKTRAKPSFNRSRTVDDVPNDGHNMSSKSVPPSQRNGHLLPPPGVSRNPSLGGRSERSVSFAVDKGKINGTNKPKINFVKILLQIIKICFFLWFKWWWFKIS